MTQPPVILGIDPGASGAIAALDAASGHLWWVEDMPAAAGSVSGALIADLLRNELVLGAWVEQVHALPATGRATAFKFGQSYGVVLGTLAALGIPVEHVTPQSWKRAARLTKDKGQSRRLAVELWPAMAPAFKRVRDDGRAEAALIARHGWLLRHPSEGAA